MRVDPEIVTLERSKSGQGNTHDNSYMLNLKRNDINEHVYKTETVSQTERVSLWLPVGKNGSERDS